MNRKQLLAMIFVLLMGILSASQGYSSSVNVALGASVVASAGRTTPENLVDADWQTYSQIDAGTIAWWEFNLGIAEKVDWLRFVGDYDYWISSYTISYKYATGDPWIEIVNYSENPLAGRGNYTNEHYLDTAVTAQYFLFERTGRYSSEVTRWYELELYQEVPDLPAIPEPSTIILLVSGLGGLWRIFRNC